MDIKDMTEDQALEMFYNMKQKFGWQGILTTKTDLIMEFEHYHERQPTDEEMEMMTTAWSWRKMEEWLSSDVQEAIIEIISEFEQGDQ